MDYLQNHPPDDALPLTSIGIIYATSDQLAAGREAEKLADREVVEVAHAIRGALAPYGVRAEPINLAEASMDSLARFDWVFNLAETIYGFPLSDDQVALELEQRGVAFTGAGSSALKACRDKAFTKNELSHYGILTPAYEVYEPGAPIRTRLRFPLIAKPLYEDGSFGITRDSLSRSPDGLAAAVKTIHQSYRQPALVEEYIDGRDITASVLGNGEEALVLPLSEIVYPDEPGPHFLTFEAKWLSGNGEYHDAHPRCPAVLDPEIAAVIADFALRACRIMDCRDYTRVDFRLRGSIPYILEVNPNPCINPCDSGFVRSATAGGYDYASLILSILRHSLRNRCLVGGSIGMQEEYDRQLANPMLG